jgi:hypothetical protein
MALTTRQTRLYNDVVDVYRRTALAVTGLMEVEDLEYDDTPILTDVQCLWASAPEDNRPESPLGRSEADLMDTLDRFHFEASVDLQDTDILEVKTTGHPEIGARFQIRGFGRRRITRGLRSGNYLAVFAKRIKGVPAGLS